jgi:hypothetical protein
MGSGREAARIATREKLTGSAWSARVDELQKDAAQTRAGALPQNPYEVQQINDATQKFVDRLTYKGKMGETGQKASDLLNAKGPGGLTGALTHLAMPFFPTIYHMTSRLMEKTPLGVLADQPKAERVYDVAMGSVMFSGLVGLGMAGSITGSGPDSPDDRKRMRDQGWRPYSVRVGDYYVPTRLLGQFAPMFNSAGDIADAIRYRKPDDDAYKLTLGAVKRLGSNVSDLVWFQGIGEILNVMSDPEQTLQSYATSNVSRALPYAATLRTVATALDPLERRAERAAAVGLPEAVRQGVAMSVPGARQTVPAARSLLGTEVENTRMGAGALLPAYGTSKPNAVLQEYERLGVSFPEVQAKKIGKVDLSAPQQRQYSEQAQLLRGQLAEKLMASPVYQKADDAAKTRLLQDATTRAAAWAGQVVAPGAGREGAEFNTSAIGKDPSKAVAGYLHALELDQELQDLRQSRFIGATGEDADALIKDRGTLSSFISAYGPTRGKMVALQQLGAARYYRALKARENPIYARGAARIRRDPDYELFIGSAPDIIARRGLTTEDLELAL